MGARAWSHLGFLKLSACLLVAVSAAAKPGCPATQKRVIVVGAGIAGAAAARTIAVTNPCIAVTVLEARGRVGGRMYTWQSNVSPLGNVTVELGAQWIGSYAKNPISPLAVKYGCRLGVQNDAQPQFTAAGRRYTDAEQASAENRYQALVQAAFNWANNQNIDVSVDKAFRQVNAALYLTSYVQARVAEDYEFEYGGLDDLSAWYYDNSPFVEDTVVLGYDRIPKGLMQEAVSAGAILLLNTVVTGIQQSATTSTVTVLAKLSTGGVRQFTAEAVIVTVPLGVLKASKVRFQPSLSAAKLGAIARLGFGTANKVALFYRKPFWDMSADEYTVEDTTTANRGRFPDWRNLKHPENENVLVGYAAGDYAKRMASLSDGAVLADAQQKVKTMFPAASLAANAAVGSAMYRWNTDPYSLGSYSYAKLGVLGDTKTTSDYDTMAAPEGRVFFGGEHTHNIYRASTHGAYLSGVREGQRVLSLLR